MDALGRVRTPTERREALLEEFEMSGMSGTKFAERSGVKCATFGTRGRARRSSAPLACHAGKFSSASKGEMNRKLLAQLGRTPRIEIVNRLKRTQGLTVGELAELLGMSYMGVKDHCVQLHKAGYLDTWRKPRPSGRPEMVYRLTDRAKDLFPRACNEATIHLLESARELYGNTAPEKLLFQMFQRKAADYRLRIRTPSPVERAKLFTRLRDNEGAMADWDGVNARITEHHSPIADLIEAFPLVARLETDMFAKVLGVAVSREESHASGLYRCTFQLHLDRRVPERELGKVEQKELRF
jgi:predicted ArsR family transcriptional regulator